MVWIEQTVCVFLPDSSKLSLHEFHYGRAVTRQSSSQLGVAYKDIDSHLRLIETHVLQDDMAFLKHQLDLSAYPQEHFLFDPTIEKVPLTMAYEL